MNSDSVWQFLQNGLRVTLGATTDFVETLQDPQKRQASLVELEQRWQEWAAKGAVTEQEAKRLFESWLRNQSKSTSPEEATPEVAVSDVRDQPEKSVEELTSQIASLRLELEKLRNSGG